MTAFQAPVELLADLDHAAEEAKVNRSEFIRRAVRRAIADAHAQKITQLPKGPTSSGPAQIIPFRETQRRGAA